MIDRGRLEQALLISAVSTKSWETIIGKGITEEYFMPNNARLYKHIKDKIDKSKGKEYPDLKLVQYEFQIEDIDMAEYTSLNNTAEMCDTLLRDYMTEKTKTEVRDLNSYVDELNNDPYKFITRMKEKVNILDKLGTTITTTDILDNIESQITFDATNVISTGFKELDDKLIGWKRGEELVTIVGRPGQGKSWIGMKLAMAGVMQGEKVGMYSGEMSEQQLQERWICCAKQRYTSTKEETVKYLRENNYGLKLITQRELRRKATVVDLEQFIIRENLSMLVVDQLSLMDDVGAKPNQPLRQAMGNISMDLFSLTVKYDLPIILLVQSNRNGGVDKVGPALEDIAESDAVGQNSTRVITLKNEKGVLTLRVVKNRYGVTDFSQRYDIDFGINKYKAIEEFNGQGSIMNRNSAIRNLFR